MLLEQFLSHRRRSSLARSHAGLFGGLLLASTSLGCLVTETNLNYCANVNGDFFCAHRHGTAGPSFCLSASSECQGGSFEPGFDGCVEVKPEASCYSPCGQGKSSLEDSSCLETAGGTATDGDATTTSGSGSTVGTSGADGTTLALDTQSTTADVTTSTTTTGTGEGSSSGSSTSTSATTEDTGIECGGMWGSTNWGGCLTEYGVVDAANLCGAGTMCVLTDSDPVTHTACTLECQDSCDCPAPPETGTATVACGNIDDDETNKCYLDCSGGNQCPDGMECVEDQFCAIPSEPAPMYGMCTAGCAFPGICAMTPNGNHQVCVAPCFDYESCVESPDLMATAMPACDYVVNPPPGEECYLNCSGGTSCPHGMTCVSQGVAEEICMWPSES